MGRKKLYAFLLAACAAGYAWLGFSEKVIHEHDTFRLCLFRALTGIPCPSCGITRSLVALMDGNPLQALYLNPLGVPALLFLLIAPLWIVTDLLLRKDSFYLWYINVEQWFRKKPIAFAAILLMITNWIWNISKDL